MKNFINDLIKRVTSRKFLITVAGLVTLAGNGQWTEFTALVLGYLTAEGASDVVDRFKSGVGTLDGYVNPESQNIEDVDTSTVVTGKDTPLFNEEVKED
jgi:hypothetical protein